VVCEVCVNRGKDEGMRRDEADAREEIDCRFEGVSEKPGTLLELVFILKEYDALINKINESGTGVKRRGTCRRRCTEKKRN
jgi:hypothetical protein